MKRVIQWHRSFKFFVPMSIAIILGGLVTSMIIGFKIGIDFQAGINTDVQFAPPSMDVSFTGTGSAQLSVSKDSLTIITQAPSGESKGYTYAWTAYPSLDSIVAAMTKVPGVQVSLKAAGATKSALLLGSSLSESTLGAQATTLHFRSEDQAVLPMTVEGLRGKIAEFGAASIQRVGASENREFMIRIEDQGKDPSFSKNIHNRLVSILGQAYGQENVIVNSSTIVGPRFSQALANQAILMTILMFSVILLYCSIRFKPVYAIAAVISVMHDALILVAFIVFARIEVNTTVIAAVLTIVGYSINDKIVIDDRIREKVKLNPGAPYRSNMNLGVTETLGRTVITAGTVLLAAIGMAFIMTGSMRDFAICIVVGVISGTYSSVFIGSAFVDAWMGRVERKKALTQSTSAPTPQKA